MISFSASRLGHRSSLRRFQSRRICLAIATAACGLFGMGAIGNLPAEAQEREIIVELPVSGPSAYAHRLSNSLTGLNNEV